MNYILFDDDSAKKLWPITLTRPVAEVLIGIKTVRQKWQFHLNSETSTLSASYLKNHFPIKIDEDNILINSAVLPSRELAREIMGLELGTKLVRQEQLIAIRTSKSDLEKILSNTKAFEEGNYEILLRKADYRNITSAYFPGYVSNVIDLFSRNEIALKDDFKIFVNGKKSMKVSSTNTLLGDEIFIDKGVKMEAVTLNSTTGPIYISRDAEIMEGAVIRGPFFLGERSVVKMGAKIYGATSIGADCKVGGELNNVVMFDYSNKGHDGFIGNSVIGSWCNLGADTNCSNLKNNYGNVRVWDYTQDDYTDSDRQFCGLIMGDHSKSGINTMFNTGTVVGVSANIFGGGFPPKHIPSFSWGGSNGFQEFEMEKAEDVASKMMERRSISFTANEAQLFKKIAEMTAKYRKDFIK